jgi:hypothetical protein
MANQCRQWLRAFARQRDESTAGAAGGRCAA